jgi:predicted dehydrogenase
MNVIKDLMQDQSLGRLMTIVFRDDQFFPVAGHYASDWRVDRDIVGSGTLLEHSIHDVDILNWLGGEVTSVRGSTANFAGHEGVEDLAMAHLAFAGGAQASLVSVWHSVIGRPSTRRLEVFMEKGIIWTDHDFIGPVHYQVHAQNPVTLGDEQIVDRYLGIIGLDRASVEPTLRYSLEDYSFLKAVQDGTDPHPGFETALDAHRIVDAIYRSAGAGGSETVPA